VVATKTEQLRKADTEPRFSLDALVKDLELAHRSAGELNLPMPVLDAVLPQMQAAVGRGLGERDFIAVALQ
jgi:3-hydroxyisobutyrate dehydrogenase-like beta-hydroxyacid dehydrogenase